MFKLPKFELDCIQEECLSGTHVVRGLLNSENGITVGGRTYMLTEYSLMGLVHKDVGYLVFWCLVLLATYFSLHGIKSVITFISTIRGRTYVVGSTNFNVKPGDKVHG